MLPYDIRIFRKEIPFLVREAEGMYGRPLQDICITIADRYNQPRPEDSELIIDTLCRLEAAIRKAKGF